MLHKLLRTFWGDLTTSELKRFGFLAAILALIVGNYWLVRSLKDALFADLVGYQWQPVAKIVSPIITVFFVMGYGKLINHFAKHKLFYILCPFYGISFLTLSYFAANPAALSLPETSILYPLFGWIPGKVMGWFTYVMIESSCLVFVLFYSFMACVTKVVSAKKGYGMVFFFFFLGMISGPLIVVKYAQRVGSPALLTLGGCLILLVPFLVKLFMKVIPLDNQAKPQTAEKQKPKTGFLEGIKLLFTRPYVAGVFVVSAFYEIVGTILEFQMNMIATSYMKRDMLAVFRAQFGIGAGILAATFALLGTSFFMRKFGLRFCLISFPSMIGIIVCSIFISRFFGATDYQYMWTIFASMIAIKGLNYTLNNPTKEVMYIPTSKDIKFKAKSWIDVFGNRTTKGIGGGVNTVFRTSLPDLLLYGTIISLGVVGIWIFVAHFVGQKFHKLHEENRIVE